MHRIVCPTCRARLKINESIARRRIRCGSCGSIVNAPDSEPPIQVHRNEHKQPTHEDVRRKTYGSFPETIPTSVAVAACVAIAVACVFCSVLLHSLAPSTKPVLNDVTAGTNRQQPVLLAESVPDQSQVVSSQDNAESPLVEPHPDAKKQEPDIELANAVISAKATQSSTSVGVDPIEAALKSVVLVKTTDGIGSGFVYGSPTTVITNFHVVDGAGDASVIFPNGTTVPVSGFRLASQQYDFVVLEVKRADPSALPMKRCHKKLNRGDDVFSLGSPKGLAGSASKGSVSAFRSWQEISQSLGAAGNVDNSQFASDSRWIQTSAPISSGNSGGPLVTSEGEVVAINTWMLVSGQNLNFSLEFGHVAGVIEHGLHQVRPLTSIPKAVRAHDAPRRMEASPKEIEAIKTYWEALSKAVTGFRTKYKAWSTGELYQMEEARSTVSRVLRWPPPAEASMLQLANSAAAEVEAIATKDVPEALAEMSLDISRKLRAAGGCYERICGLRPEILQEERVQGGLAAGHVSRRGAINFSPVQQAQLEQERISATRAIAELSEVIHATAPRVKRVLEEVIGEELPQLDQAR